MHNNQKRINTLRQHMRKNAWDAICLTGGGDLQYIIGLERGENNPTENNMHGEDVYGAYISEDKVIFVLPELAVIASEFGSPLDGLSVLTDDILLTDNDSSVDVAKKVLGLLGNPSVMGMNARGWVRNAITLQTAAPGMEIIDAGHVLAQMRSVKDDYEIELMRACARLTDLVFGEVIKRIRIGTNELEILEEIRHQCLINGGSGMSFHPSASVRAGNTQSVFYEGGSPRTVVEPGAVISFDFGCIYKGYASDFGRTLFVGDPIKEHVRYHHAVMETQKLAIDAMKSGQITASALDKLAHDHMESLGLGDMFIHRLGHGVGIDVHEMPYAYPRDDTLLVSGMTLAIEPSCYKPRVVGVRVEDIVLVTDHGGEQLTDFSHDLLVI